MQKSLYTTKDLQYIILCIENDMENYTLTDITKIANILESCVELCNEILANH